MHLHQASLKISMQFSNSYQTTWDPRNVWVTNLWWVLFVAMEQWEIAFLVLLSLVSRMATVLEELQRDVYEGEFDDQVQEHPEHRDSPVITHLQWLMMQVQQIEQISASVAPEARGSPRSERSRSRSRSACRRWLRYNLEGDGEASGSGPRVPAATPAVPTAPAAPAAPPPRAGGEEWFNFFSRHMTS